MRVKIKDTKIKITVLFFGIMLLLILFDKSGYIIPSILAVLVHETAHLITMYILGCAPKEIILIPASVQIVRKIEPKPKNEILISASGPLASMFFFTAFYVFYCIFHNENLLTFAVINLLYGLFNLLPVKNLDGGQILSVALKTKLPENRVNLIINIITLVLCVVALFFGLALFGDGSMNFSLIILSVYFLLSVLIKL